MYKRISQSGFVNEFKSWETYANNFSYEGLEALYDYLESIAEDMGDDKGIELDVVSICCDYTEYASALEAVEDMGCTVGGMPFTPSDESKALEFLQDNTAVIEFEGGVIIAQF